MEVSRVNVVYFLSQNGRVEHPHLIRARHLGRTGVRLRDVKRWLAEMRGKDMPDTFAWSYKRKYRTGFVWQDVMDDDLLTPISDNEYVLKGSQQVNLHATAKRHHFLSLDNSPAPAIHEKDQAPGAADDQDDGRKAVDLQEAPPRSSSVEILKQDDGDFIASSGASDEPTIWRKAVFRIDAFRGRGWKEKAAAGADKEGKGGGGARMLNSSRSHGNAGYAKRATEVLRSVLRCRDICTDYEALHPIRRRREKGRSSSAAADSGRVKQNGSYRTERSNRSGEGAKRTGDKGVHPTAFNPAYVPHCSQSGRTFKFKPEKLHLHT